MNNDQYTNTISFGHNDMSEYVVHFTKKTDESDVASVCKLILAQKVILAKKSWGTDKSQIECPKSVCFTEVPLHELRRFISKYGEFGIGFRKEHIVGKGGGPIMYAYSETRQSEIFKNLARNTRGNKDDPIWKLAPFVDHPGKTAGVGSYFFEWEREWRHIGDLEFSESDPAFFIFPEENHKYFREFMDGKNDEKFPRYSGVPFISIKWSKEQIEQKVNANYARLRTLSTGNGQFYNSSVF